MIPGKLANHPQRYELVNELHARPFQPVGAPGRVLFLALTTGESAREAERAHLTALMKRFGGPHPSPDADQHVADLGRLRVKWERHTEFVSYILMEEGEADGGLFRQSLAPHLPEDWLAEAPGPVIAAVEIEILTAEDADAALSLMEGRLAGAFTGESLAAAQLLDGQVLAMGDFRVHEGGFTRFAIVVHGEPGSRRLGRLVQRLTEIVTYQTLALLALPMARSLTPRITAVSERLTELIGQVGGEAAVGEADILAELTALSAEIEKMSAESAFRFGAAGAYSDLVTQRINALREDWVGGRQTFGEFTRRRFEPAMRTCRSVEGRLSRLAGQATRGAELLRTRVDVALEAANQKLLASMDRRADLQLRLQQTVEGLSVVAISYYAVSLGAILAAPLAIRLGHSKETAAAVLVLPVVIAVWAVARRIRRRIERKRRKVG